MSSLAKHIIHQPKPHRRILWVIAVIVITILVQWFLQRETLSYYQQKIVELESSLQHVNSRLEQNNNRNAQLNDHNLQLDTDNAQLDNTIRDQQHELAIEKATIAQLEQQLGDLQQQVLMLNKELMFYQTVTQGTGSSKLQIRELDLSATDIGADVFRYRLVITQGKKISKPITGTITVTLNSRQEDKLAQDTLGEYKLNLRHVQVIEGQIKLTDNSTPETIKVTLKQGKKTLLTQTFDWQLTDNY